LFEVLPGTLGTTSDGSKDTLNGFAGIDEVWGNISTDLDSLTGETVHSA
jgi:hypothetical protein